MSLLATRLAWQRRAKAPPGGDPLRVALLATYTADPLVPYLGMALAGAGFAPAVHVGPYDRVVPECLDPGSETAAFRPDVLVVHARLEDLWAGLPWPTGEADPEPYVADLLALADAAERLGTTVLFVLPAIPAARPLGRGDAIGMGGVAALASRAREALRARAPWVVDMEDAVRALGLAQALAPQLQAVARIPYTEAAFAHLGRDVAAAVALARRPAKKVVVLDADHTLWGGVVGEDGPAGLALSPNTAGEAFTDFQGYMLALRRAGVLLALCSKNEEADVWAAFERPEMRIQKSDLAAWRVNWRPKSQNLREMADELGLGLSSFVFIDDNPVELAEVAAHAPEVATIQFPADPAEWLAVVQGAGLLDRLPPTAEDRARAGQYAVEARRMIVRDLDPTAYLAGLGLEVRVFAPGEGDMPRLAQLLAKTNQLNLNGVRHDADALVADGEVRLVAAKDRFGDYGTVGAFAVRDGELAAFLLSCRALARGVEEAMLAAAQRLASPLRAHVVELPRNMPARAFFAKHGVPADGGTHPTTPCAWPSHVAGG